MLEWVLDKVPGGQDLPGLWWGGLHMAALSIFALVTGWVIAFVGGIMFLVVAFRESVLWGLAVLFIPFASLVFLIKYWSEVKKAFMLQLLGMLIFFLSIGTGSCSGSRPFRVAPKAAGTTKSPEQAISWSMGKIEKILQQDAAEARVNTEGSDDTFVGQTLEELKAVLGPPKGTLETETETTYFYPGLEIISTDGVTVAEQGIRSDE